MKSKNIPLHLIALSAWLTVIFLGCSRDARDENLYTFMVQKIEEYRSSPLIITEGFLPVLENGWSAKEDKEGVIVTVDDPTEFRTIDRFFRESLGDPANVWEDGHWVVYSVRQIGAMVSYEKFEDPDGAVQIIILREQT